MLIFPRFRIVYTDSYGSLKLKWMAEKKKAGRPNFAYSGFLLKDGCKFSRPERSVTPDCQFVFSGGGGGGGGEGASDLSVHVQR